MFFVIFYNFSSNVFNFKEQNMFSLWIEFNYKKTRNVSLTGN